MKQSSIEWLVSQICTEVEKHDEYGDVNGVELWNAFRSCTDLYEYVVQAKQMWEKEMDNAYDKGIKHEKENIRQFLIDEDFELLAEKI